MRHALDAAAARTALAWRAAMSASVSTLDSLASALPTDGRAVPAPPRVEKTSLRVVLGLLVLLSAAVFFQFIPWLVLAAWLAVLVAPVHERLARLTRGRGSAAAIVLLVVVSAVVLLCAALVLTLSEDASHLLNELNDSRSGRAALRTLVTPGAARGTVRLDGATLLAALESHAAHAFTLVDGASGVALGLFVLFTGTYACLVDGQRAVGWLERNTPLADRHIHRFAGAFLETGRGLMTSVVFTGIAQAAVATAAYVALDIPRAPVLGVLTLLVSVLPSIGTALVWGPVTVGLWLTGRETDAVILGVVGVFVISSIDNLLRPALARWGKLDLHPMVVLVSMLGGLALFGGFGLFLGPLATRWLLEAVRIARQERLLS